MPRDEKVCYILYANNKDADQPAHQRNLISAFVVRCLSAKSLVSRLKLVSVPEQAGLSIICLQTPEEGFLVTGLNLYDILNKEI